MAGLGRKEFNSGDILLASEVQGYLQDQAVMVFDDDTARGSAIASPSEGMLTYNKDTDQLELYDGSDFVGVGGDSGLVHIKTVDTGGAVAAIGIGDLSDPVFTSSYDLYKIYWEFTGTSGESLQLQMRLDGSSNNESLYAHQQIAVDSTSVTASRQTSQTSGACGVIRNGVRNFGFIEIYGASLATATQYASFSNDQGNTISFRQNFGIHDKSTAYNGITFFPTSGTIDGTVTILGVKK